VDAVHTYGYDTKIMFSSVRHSEHVRNAINVGVHTITVPLKILKQLTENNFTTVGTEQFITDTRLMTVRVKEVLNGKNPIVKATTGLTDAIIKLTEFGFGAITVVNDDGSVKGVFTDGTLRRLIGEKGRDVLQQKLSDLTYREPIAIDSNALLNDANVLFKKTNVDTILVTENGKPVGMLDIQDI
jgi:signal-transduction protein with cAMP-binding, CBS, and nucleotidyltransferase domain